MTKKRVKKKKKFSKKKVSRKKKKKLWETKKRRLPKTSAIKDAEKILELEDKHHWKPFILSVVIVFAFAAIGNLFTAPVVRSAWYESIKPSITPPNWIFPVVWTILFFLIALSLYFIWVSKKQKEKNKIIINYGINFVLNILWSFFYFGLKSPLQAFFVVILLWISILYLIIFDWKINKKSSYLLIPYLLWVSFAIILNYFYTKMYKYFSPELVLFQ